MKRQIFRKVPISEKKILFREGAQNRIPFHAKGDSDELVNMILTEYHEGKLLVFEYAQGSARFNGIQPAVLNFATGEDRYFFHSSVESFENKVMVPTDVDVYVLQRRKTPRLDIPHEFPAGLNIISHQGRTSLMECKLLDFSSGGCRVHYPNQLPAFKSGDEIKVVVHLSHRRPLELDAVIRHHVIDEAGRQNFGMQFKILTQIMENKLLVTFMDLQRELFVKWSSE